MGKDFIVYRKIGSGNILEFEVSDHFLNLLIECKLKKTSH
jgi:hypothetical protein